MPFEFHLFFSLLAQSVGTITSKAATTPLHCGSVRVEMAWKFKALALQFRIWPMAGARNHRVVKPKWKREVGRPTTQGVCLHVHGRWALPASSQEGFRKSSNQKRLASQQLWCSNFPSKQDFQPGLVMHSIFLTAIC